MIKDTVPVADKNGKSLECHVDPPIGSASNPVDPGRVIIHTDAAGTVVHIPKNEQILFLFQEVDRDLSSSMYYVVGAGAQ